jgi:Fe-S-cluster-containing dehydrogenase component
MACPYNVRYLNEDERVVEKCTLCEQKIANGEIPQCVAQCGGFARFFGDIDVGLDSFLAPEDTSGKHKTLAECIEARFVEPYADDQIHRLPDIGNKPSFLYILRNHTWKGGGA